MAKMIESLAAEHTFIFPLCAGSNPINAFIYFSSVLLYHVITCVLQALLENSFNIYTKCPPNGTLSNTKTHMRNATECINSIGYALFAVIKVSKGAKIRNRYNQVVRKKQPKWFGNAYELYL